MDLQNKTPEIVTEATRLAMLQRADYLRRLALGIRKSTDKLIDEADALKRDLKTV